MALNWSPEVITSFIAATTALIAVLISRQKGRNAKIDSLKYIRRSWIFMTLFLYFNGISLLLMSLFLYRIYVLFLLPAIIFFIIGINYTIKESFNSVSLIFVSCLGILFCYLAFQPDTVKAGTEYGYPTINWVGPFLYMAVIFQILMSLVLFYWVLKTWINAPFLIKKEANLLLTGGILLSPVGVIIYLISLWIPSLILISDIILAIGGLILILSLKREPKLLYILPFTVYRVLVKDKEGFPLFDHDWSKSEINENVFTGFINAIQLMSEEVLTIGGVVDIHLEEGILTLHKSELITVGLVASKSSKLLKECLVNFSNDFQKTFERELKKSVKDMVKYDAAYELIEKYFSNFPYRIITSKNYPLSLTGKYADIPPELENKFKQVITDKKEYEFIMSELIKYPPCVSDDLINLYKEVKEEPEKLPEEEYKYLDSEFDEESPG